MHNNIGNSYRSNKDLNKAREHIEQAKEMMMLMHGDDPVEEMAKVSVSDENQLIIQQIHVGIVLMGCDFHGKSSFDHGCSDSF